MYMVLVYGSVHMIVMYVIVMYVIVMYMISITVIFFFSINVQMK